MYISKDEGVLILTVSLRIPLSSSISQGDGSSGNPKAGAKERGLLASEESRPPVH
ncbi:hypothetical protein [Neobacillus dielmonensis]|uniref:hypothetical protein n=1 Tax=Neobacillus dielmonensis TaxID=1347369 RepID=UPI000B25EC6B|nr:hypothetical protein [Neobacillus dielmonensis]